MILCHYECNLPRCDATQSARLIPTNQTALCHIQEHHNLYTYHQPQISHILVYCVDDRHNVIKTFWFVIMDTDCSEQHFCTDI